MREIKFKAWDKSLKKMIQVTDLNLKTGYLIGEINTKLTSCNFCFGNCELMQYTGLKDKNGIEIYEGDILTSEHYPFQDEGKYNYHGIVEWADEIAATCITKSLVNKSKRGISDGIADIIEDTEQFEVIGNIYSNPELLEGKK